MSSIMASQNVPDSSSWEQNELSELRNLLQRAEQRIRKAETASNSPVRVAKSNKYAMVVDISTRRI